MKDNIRLIIEQLHAPEYKFDATHAETLTQAVLSKDITRDDLFQSPENLSELKKRYKALALKTHPDKKGPESGELFAVIDTAYKIEQKRYDANGNRLHIDNEDLLAEDKPSTTFNHLQDLLDFVQTPIIPLESSSLAVINNQDLFSSFQDILTLITAYHSRKAGNVEFFFDIESVYLSEYLRVIFLAMEAKIDHYIQSYDNLKEMLAISPDAFAAILNLPKIQEKIAVWVDIDPSLLDSFESLKDNQSAVHLVNSCGFDHLFSKIMRDGSNAQWVFKLLNDKKLKNLLDHEDFSLQTLFADRYDLVFDKMPKFSDFLHTPEVITIVTTHPKTAFLLERVDQKEGDFIDVMSRNPSCLAAGLNAPYYQTNDGKYALWSAVHRYLEWEGYREGREAYPLIVKKLQDLGLPLQCAVKAKELLAPCSPAEMYNAIKLRLSDHTKDVLMFSRNHRDMPNVERFLLRKIGAHTIYNDAHLEVARIYFLNTTTKPRIVYYPGVLNSSKCQEYGAPLLMDIKQCVDKQLKKEFPNFEIENAVHHYTFIVGKNEYIAGVGYGINHLDVHYAPSSAFNLISRHWQKSVFQAIEAFAASFNYTTTFWPCVMFSPFQNPKNLALASHEYILGTIKNNMWFPSGDDRSDFPESFFDTQSLREHPVSVEDIDFSLALKWDSFKLNPSTIGLGFFYAVAGLINKAATGQFLFFKTDSADMVDQLQQRIDSRYKK